MYSFVGTRKKVNCVPVFGFPKLFILDSSIVSSGYRNAESLLEWTGRWGMQSVRRPSIDGATHLQIIVILADRRNNGSTYSMGCI